MAAQEASTAVQLATFVGQAVAIGFGWYIVHRLSAQRDRDKARRDMLAKSADELSNDSKKVLLLARAYHLDERSTSKEIEVKMALQDMALRAAALSQICNEHVLLANCRSTIKALRRAVTGTHFEDEHLGPLKEADSQFQSIAMEALQVQQAFLRLKHQQFPVG